MIRITQIKISIDEPVSKVKSLVLKKNKDYKNLTYWIIEFTKNQLMQDIEAKLILSILLILNLKMKQEFCLKKIKKMFLWHLNWIMSIQL